MTEFDLNAIIDKALAGREPDPHVIARRILPRIPAEERDAVLGSLLVERVTFRLRTARSERLAVDQPSRDHQITTVGGKSRYQRHMAAIRDRYHVQSGWKFYADLTAEDCDEIATAYQERAEKNAALADRFRLLATRLRNAGAARVADLEGRAA